MYHSPHHLIRGIDFKLPRHAPLEPTIDSWRPSRAIHPNGAGMASEFTSRKSWFRCPVSMEHGVMDKANQPALPGLGLIGL